MTMVSRKSLFQSAETTRYLRRGRVKQIAFAVGGTIFAWLAMVYYSGPAHARGLHRHHAVHHRRIATRAPATHVIVCGRFGCRGETNVAAVGRKSVRHEVPARPERIRIARFDANGNSGSVIGGRPAGCPAAFCGCGLRKYLGLDDKRLDLAWNWPRLYGYGHIPHDGDFAARHHHVMLIEQMTGPMRAIVRDYNGGRHLSYIHERDLHGYVFGRPGGGRLASAF